ncbi:hypothetical protein IT40_25270 [Paracoccus versutus]|nr:hypothetical protein IT40_25270 [Paracoccus versutus]
MRDIRGRFPMQTCFIQAVKHGADHSPVTRFARDAFRRKDAQLARFTFALKLADFITQNISIANACFIGFGRGACFIGLLHL